MAKILAIDPGPVESGWVLIDEDLRPLDCGKTDNEDLLDMLFVDFAPLGWDERPHYVIERVAAYGMGVGQETFDTAWWAGRFYEAARTGLYPHCHMLFRREVKLHLVGKANIKNADSVIKQVLIDRFAYGYGNYGKGTKNNPSWFYEFKKIDIWQAYALAVTFAETEGSENQ